MIVVITLEAKDEKELDANLQAIRHSIIMGDLDNVELMDGSYQINNKTNIEYYETIQNHD